MATFLQRVTRRPFKLILVLAGMALLAAGLSRLTSVSTDNCGPRLLNLYSWPRVVIVVSLVTLGAWLAWTGRRTAEAQARQLVGNLAVVVLSLGLTVMALEAAIRLTDPPPDFLNKPSQSVHPTIGTWLTPNDTHTEISPQGEFSESYRTDGEGVILRGGSNAPQAGARRIVLVGDSFFAGSGVAPDEAISVYLEVELAGRLDEPVQAVSISLGGLSPVQFLMVYRDLGAAYEPDVVVVSLYLPNDFTEDAGLYHDERIIYDASGAPTGVRPFVDADAGTAWMAGRGEMPYSDAHGKLISPEDWDQGLRRVLTRVVRDRVCEALSTFEPDVYTRATVDHGQIKSGENLACTNMSGALTPRCTNYAIRDASLVRNNQNAIYKENYTPADVEDIERTLGHFALLAEEAEAAGAAFVLVIIPSGSEIDGQMPGLAGRQGLEPGQLIDSHTPYATLDDFCSAHDLTCVNLLPEFRANSDQQLYWFYNIHWTADGHQLAAQTLADALEPLLAG